MTEITEVPSPFCGIGTDDLTIQVDGIALKVTANGCAVNTPAFEFPITDSQARVEGQLSSLETAVSKAAEILRKTNQPLFGGCATDVNGMRALLALADRCGAVVDNVAFNIARRNLLALQDTGWMNTTLAELKTVAISWWWSVPIWKVSLRDFSSGICGTKKLCLSANTDSREIIYLGKSPSGQSSNSPSGRKAMGVALCR